MDRPCVGRAGSPCQCCSVGVFLYSERDDFADFHLRVEVLVDDGGDGGLFFRSPFGPSGAPRPVSPLGYEADIRDGDAGSLFTLPENASAPRLLRRGNSPARRGEWITLEAIAVENHIVTKVDGVTVMYFRDDSIALHQGPHCVAVLGSHETKVKFRKIEIKQLDGENQFASIASEIENAAQKDRQAAEELEQQKQQQLKQSIEDLESGGRVVDLSNQHIQKREIAIDRLKALGPAAIPASNT